MRYRIDLEKRAEALFEQYSKIFYGINTSPTVKKCLRLDEELLWELADKEAYEEYNSQADDEYTKQKEIV